MTDPIDLDRPDLKERARALYSWDNRIRLLTDNETLRAEVERLKAERDTAFNDGVAAASVDVAERDRLHRKIADKEAEVERLRDDVSSLTLAVKARDIGLRDVAKHSEWLTAELARVRAEYRVLDDAYHHRVVAPEAEVGPAFTPMANGPSYVDPASMLAYLAANPEPAPAAVNDVNSDPCVCGGLDGTHTVRGCEATRG